MAQSEGILTAAATLGLQSLLIKPARAIADFTTQVTFEEQHEDVMEITEQPVEMGSRITDHSYVRPATLTVHCGFSNSPNAGGLLDQAKSIVSGTIGGVSAILNGNSVSQVKDTYAKLLQLQQSRIPFTVVTGKRAYTSMLVQSLKVTTDKESENTLNVTATFKQIVIVGVNTVTFGAPTEAQPYPEITDRLSPEGIKSLVPALNYNAGAGRGAINPALVIGQ